MKLLVALFFAAALAAPLATDEAACKLSLQQIASWDESGRRYRVQADAWNNITGNATMIDKLCNIYYEVAGPIGWGTVNPQCHRHGQSMGWLDTSVGHGPAGTNEHKLIYDAVISRMKDQGYSDCEYTNHST